MAAPLDRAEALEPPFPGLQARAARAGWRLTRSVDKTGRPRFVLSRWGRAIDCADIGAVRVAMARVGVSA